MKERQQSVAAKCTDSTAGLSGLAKNYAWLQANVPYFSPWAGLLIVPITDPSQGHKDEYVN